MRDGYMVVDGVVPAEPCDPSAARLLTVFVPVVDVTGTMGPLEFHPGRDDAEPRRMTLHAGDAVVEGSALDHPGLVVETATRRRLAFATRLALSSRTSVLAGTVRLGSVSVAGAVLFQCLPEGQWVRLEAAVSRGLLGRTHAWI